MTVGADDDGVARRVPYLVDDVRAAVGPQGPPHPAPSRDQQDHRGEQQEPGAHQRVLDEVAQQPHVQPRRHDHERGKCHVRQAPALVAGLATAATQGERDHHAEGDGRRHGRPDGCRRTAEVEDAQASLVADEDEQQVGDDERHREHRDEPVAA